MPHFYGGRWAGRAEVFGRDPVALAPRGMADLVGFVFQDPEAQFVVDTVEDELAFAMENFALPPATMRKRVEEVLDQMGIAHLRNRRISTLSGGEKQRVAIASVLTLQPEVLVLDEPTSQLDPQAAEEVLIALRQLNEDLGLTIMLSEHRLERVVQYADRMLYLPGPGRPPVLDEPRGPGRAAAAGAAADRAGPGAGLAAAAADDQGGARLRAPVGWSTGADTATRRHGDTAMPANQILVRSRRVAASPRRGSPQPALRLRRPPALRGVNLAVPPASSWR